MIQTQLRTARPRVMAAPMNQRRTAQITRDFTPREPLNEPRSPLPRDASRSKLLLEGSMIESRCCRPLIATFEQGGIVPGRINMSADSPAGSASTSASLPARLLSLPPFRECFRVAVVPGGVDTEEPDDYSPGSTGRRGWKIRV